LSSAQASDTGKRTRDGSPRRRGFPGKIAAAILYAAVAAPPFLFGSREPITIAAWCALLGAALVFAPIRRLQRAHLLLLGGIAILIALFGFVLHEQLSDHPWIAPFNPVWGKASEALGRPLAPSVSVVRGEPFFALGHPLANVLALILGIIVGVDLERARRAIQVMAWAGVGYAVYGILAYAFDPMNILWREKTGYFGNLTATFINRNTAACYFGSCAVVWLVLLMAAIRRKLPPGPIKWRRAAEQLLQETRKDVLLRFVMMFVCLAAMFMTSSRGGVLASLGVMALTFLVYFGPDLPRRTGFLGILLVCAVTILLLLQLFGGNVASRIDAYGLGDPGRLSTWRSTLKIIADNPWFGTGLGTFAYAFPPYRSGDISMWGRWELAHSTPLELASDLGIPLAIAVAAAWFVALVLLARVVLAGRRSTMTLPLSALAVSLIALLHSSIDFSLQIAGYSIVVFSLLGLGLSQAVLTSSRRSDASGRDAPQIELRRAGISVNTHRQESARRS